MKIIYRGKPYEKLEKTLEMILNLFQYELTGSGYNLVTNERDLEFEKRYRKGIKGLEVVDESVIKK